VITFKYIVTAALPYVNNVPHLGHLISTLLPADVYSRFLKIKGEKCVYICGTDEYGTTTEVAALKEGISPKELTDRYFKIHKEGFEKLDCRPDIFSRTSHPDHTKLVQNFYNKVKKNDYIYKKEIEQLYCEHCKRFLPDRFVEGTCPHCNYEKAKGDQCESCGRVLNPADLINPGCITCGNKPFVKKSEHVFFALSKLGGRLSRWIEKQDHWFANARNFALSWLREIQDRDISRDIKWGVPVPDAKGQVFYSWFDAPLGYVTFTNQIGKGKWWHDKDTRLIHFIGKDNIPFHTVFFPGMLIAAEDYVLPWQVASYEFLNWEEGKKFSKSLGIGLTVPEANKLYPADYWRYYLLSILTEKKDSNFSWDEFQSRINSDLNDTVGNFVHRTLTFTQNFFEGKIPKPAKYSKADEKALKSIDRTYEKVTKHLENIELKAALNEVVNLARIGNQYMQKEEPWKNKDRRATVLYVCLNISHALSILLEPFLPSSASRIKKFLNTKGKWKDTKSRLKIGTKLGKFEPLFKKIESKEIERYKKKYGGKSGHAKPVKKMVSFKDFGKIDLRVGKVLKAEKIKGADRLLKLEVDTGEKRTIVSGVAKWYSPKDLVGKEVVVVVNLEAKKLKGIESQGMLLAAKEGEKLSIVTLDKKLAPGTEVL
jgi:methionyl-tRNA synthetase